MPKLRSYEKIKGFTLLEMSIVLVLIGVIVTGGMTIFSASLKKRQAEETQFKMQAIQDALYNFRVAKNRIPCPADVTLASTDANFGAEASVPGDCMSGAVQANFSAGGPTVVATGNITLGSADIVITSGNASSVVANDLLTGYVIQAGMFPPGNYGLGRTVSSVSGTTVSMPALDTALVTASNVNMVFTSYAQGMVPTQALRLPDDYAFDGWGRRIMYTVSKDMTQANAFSLVLYNDTSYRIGISTTQTNDPLTYQAVYALLSAGPNGHGAYPRAKGQALNLATSRINAHSTNPYEWANCHCDTHASDTGLLNVGLNQGEGWQMILSDQYSKYDDVVVYATRAMLASPSE